MPEWQAVQRPTRSNGQAGFSLPEVLVTLAIAAMVGLALTSVLMALAFNDQRETKQTEHYESLRLAGHLLIQDARYARSALAGPDGVWLILYLKAGYSDYVKYTFATWDGSAEGIPDPENLHRWDIQGGEMVRDDVVAYDLASPDPLSPDFDTQTYFVAVAGSLREVIGYLRKSPLPGQSAGTTLQVMAHLR